jgi:hypothetical protein
MLRVALFMALFTVCGFSRNCIKYGAPVSLRGTLAMKDEAGYIQFTVFRPARALCVVGGPKDTADPDANYYRTQSGIREIQTGVYESGATSALRDRLDRLVGQRVVIKGDLFPATTGYHRTNVQFRVNAVEAVDQAGQKALHTPAVPFAPRDVRAYNVTISAKRRLKIEARDSESSRPLLPAAQYVPNWMTGGDVLYVDCREGYERKLISSTEKNGGICANGDLCGLSAFPKSAVIIKFSCHKKP